MKNDKIICKSCESEIEEDFNFCPYCGEPLNTLAEQFYKMKSNHAKAEILYSLSGITKDTETVAKINYLLNQLH